MHWPDQNTSHELPPYLDKLNPAQKEAAMQTDGPVMIIAGAGSGKTRVLTFRIAYMIENGIDAERLVAKGYGESIPRLIDQASSFFQKGDRITDDYIAKLKSDPEKEEAHQMNRRTEFRVLRSDYVPKAKPAGNN